MKRLNLRDQKFGRLTVLSPARAGGRRSKWFVKCDCGTIFVLLTESITSGHTKSCGCLKSEICRVGARMRNAQRPKPKLSRKEYVKAWRSSHKEHLKSWWAKRRNQIQHRLSHALYSRVGHAVKGLHKTAKTVELLGCSFESFRIYIESKFEVGMSWENYGKKPGQWSVDHIIPCALFDLKKPEHQRRCFHFSNLQPMWAVKNSSKGKQCLTDQFSLL